MTNLHHTHKRGIETKAFVINPIKYPDFKGEEPLVRLSDVQEERLNMLYAVREMVEVLEKEEDFRNINSGHDAATDVKTADDNVIYNQALTDILTQIDQAIDEIKNKSV